MVANLQNPECPTNSNEKTGSEAATLKEKKEHGIVLSDSDTFTHTLPPTFNCPAAWLGQSPFCFMF